MTRHRKPEERIGEILDAAAALVEKGGYHQLTMEAVAARTELSKAGVYRFFPNRHAIGLALFQRVYLRILDFEIEEALAWGLTVPDTLFRLLFERFNAARDQRDRRVWLQLVPETLRDKAFRRQRRRLQELARQRFRSLVLRLVERDGLPVTADFRTRLDEALELGVALMEGLTLQESSNSRQAQSLLLRRFLDVMVAHATEHADATVILSSSPAVAGPRG